MTNPLLPEDSQARKDIPVLSGVLDYFDSALIAVAKHSKAGNDKHNPGEPLHHARGKSSDHLDAAVRHIMERDLVGAAWRVLAALQEEEESKGAPLARGARLPTTAREEFIEAVTETEAPLEDDRPLKVGDEVVIVNSRSYGSDPLQVGKKGYITEIGPNLARVRPLGGYADYFFTPKDVVRVS